MRKRKKQYGNQLHARSKITNGHRILPSIDHRSMWARRFRDLIASFASDLGADDDSLSEGQRALVRRASALCIECEHMEVRFADNGGADVDDLNVYQRATNTMRRVVESLAIHHGRIIAPKDVTPSLGDLIRQDQQEERERLAAERAAAQEAAE